MDEEINDADKNQYHLDDDDFLSAPGGLLKDNESTHESSEAPIDITTTNPTSITTEEQKTNNNNNNNNIKLKKPTSIPYGISDDTSDSSDDNDIANNNRKYTHQSQPTEDDIDNNNNNNPTDNKKIGKQYTILLNDKSFLSEPNANYPTNYIKTAKYTPLTFIPLNLFEQFRRIANIYFLIIIGIQLIPGVSPFPIGTSIMPLAFILCVGAIKDGIEDYDRHKQDKIANGMGILRLNPISNQFKKCRSDELEPSDIILIKRNEQIPSDCIVLSTQQLDKGGNDNDNNNDNNDNNSGVCYINTSSMDGENAPKLRRAVQSTHQIYNSHYLSKLQGYIKCPPNNKSLHGFTGALSIKKSTLHNNNNNSKLKTKKAKLDEKSKLNEISNNYGTIDDDDDQYLAASVKTNAMDAMDAMDAIEEGDIINGLSDINFIFRGSKLVNTDYIYGLVLFVGPQTKLMLNRNSVPFKFSKFERILNTMILSILIFNFLLCIAFGIIANSLGFEPYSELRRQSWFHGFLLDTCSWLILTSWMIPFSLYVTLELVKMIQAQWIAWDENMTYNPEPSSNTNTQGQGHVRRDSVTVDHSWDEEYGGRIRHAKTKNSNLNEELGHIDYIFTDKTGTLTQNQMELSKCSVGGIKYSLNANASSGDYESFNNCLINRMILYQSKKYELYKLMNKESKNKKELMNIINSELNEQLELNKLNSKHGTFTLQQLENDTHFLLNLLLCSSTLPVIINNNNKCKQNQNNQNETASSSSNLLKIPPPSLTNQTLVASHSNNNNNNAEEEKIDEKKIDKTEEIEYQSPSPDEVAFAEALYDSGIILSERNADGGIIIRINNNIDLQYRVLATLDFTAARKRMSVVISDAYNNIYLYSKGADSTLFRLCQKNKNNNSNNLIHLTKRHITSFARDGSRTLVIGYKKLTELEFEDFFRFYNEACVTIGSNRQELIESSFSYIEQNLYLLGCTAVEDQMQIGVPESIYKLKAAKIKVIMLTGDKQETAVSIARQSLIIGSNILDSQLMYLQSKSIIKKDINQFEKQMRRIDKKLTNFINKINERLQDQNDENNEVNIDNPIIDKQPALILNGDALEMCLHPAIIEKFVILFEYCSTIICNRCNPSQKAMLVEMAKSSTILNGVALAIGDGANDVSMIQASNVGIGIMGKEGTQASLAADFVIHRFKHIVPLLFIHGRYSFLRTSKVSLISLYKNMAFMLTVIYYGIYSLYTAQSCFDPYLMSAFNLMFTAAFPLMVGAFEQDIKYQTAMNHPKAYYYFKINSFFNIKYFLFWMYTALWQSVIWFIISIYVYYNNLDIWDKNGKNGGLYVWGTQLFTTNVIVICLKMMAETYHWNWTYYISTAGGFIIYIITCAILSNWLYLDSDMFYIMEFTFNNSLSWLILIVQCVVCLFPGILYNLWKRERYASLSTILYEAQKFGYLTKNGIHRATNDIIQDYLRR